jgi:hypothetical protein
MPAQHREKTESNSSGLIIIASGWAFAVFATAAVTGSDPVSGLALGIC